MGGHTPGPWPWKYTGDGKRIIVGEGLVDGPGGYEVAEVYSDDCSPVVAEANASLIAAAPELLEAVEACAKVLAHQGIAPAVFRQVEDAIAKARGEARTQDNGSL